MSINNTLKNLGLTDQEVRIYLASLGLGPASVQKVAHHSGIKRPTVYVIARSLIEKGFMGYYIDKNGKKLVAEPADKISSLAQKRLDDLTAALPELKALSSSLTEKPQVTFYEGRESAIAVAEDSLQLQNTTVYMMGSLRDIHAIVTEKYDRERYIPTRLKNNLFTKAIITDDATSRRFKAEDKQQLRETKLMPITYSFPTFEIIYGDKVAFFSSQKETFGMIIKSKDYAETERKKFQFFWDTLKS